MVPQTGDEIRYLLDRVRAGDQEARNQLTARVYPELKRIAQILMAGERKNHTLGATGSALVNLLWLRLLAPPEGDEKDDLASIQDLQHLLRVSARNMRQILIDYARSRKAQKRPNPKDQADIEEGLLKGSDENHLNADVLTVHELLAKLEKSHPEQAGDMEVKYFLGLTNDEGAAAFGVPLIKYRRNCQFAEAWMQKELKKES